MENKLFVQQTSTSTTKKMLNSSTVFLFLGLLMMIIIGLLYTRYTWIESNNRTTQRALDVANTIEISLNDETASQLRAVPEDENTVAYKSLKEKLISLIKIHSEARFIYFYKKNNGKLFFMVDSEPATSEDYSPPGQEYTEEDVEAYLPFEDGKVRITNPTTDRWGTWVSILVPIKNHKTGEVYAILGIDYPANKWKREALLNASKSAIISFGFMLLLIALYIISKNNSILIKQKNERKKAEEQMAAMSAVVEQSDDIIVVKDLQLRVVAANNSLVELTGNNSVYELIGKTDADIFHTSKELEPVRTYMNDELHAQTLKKGEYVLREEELISADGKVKTILTKKYPIFDKDNKLIFTGSISRDITKRKQVEADLKIKEERLKDAQKIGKTGHWEFDIPQNKLYWSEQTFDIYEQNPAEFVPTFDGIIDLYHPDERAIILNEFNNCIATKKELSVETRIVTPSGNIKYAMQRAKVQYDGDKPLLLLGTVADITEQKMVEIELKKSKELAEAASVAKSDFLSNMSHEIRTPLNGVIGFTDLLRNTNLNTTQKEYLDNAIISANSLLGVISDILDFSKIEAGKLDLEFVKVDLVQLVESASDIIKVHASKKNLELLLNIQPDMPRLALIDPIRLKQILVNLMSNAVKFTHAGEVELKLTFEKKDDKTGYFTIAIRDTGIGVKESDKDKLFKAFSQADTSTTRRYGGTGLGLIISNSLAHKMGGRIQFESEYGRGSTFRFTIQTEYEKGDSLDFKTSNPIRRVLFIDDNANNRLILEHTFMYWGIECVGCESGLKGLKVLDSDPHFDLIIVDYHMPTIDGVETIKRIRKDTRFTSDKQAIIMLHSSSDDITIHEAARELDIQFSLTKPVKSDELYCFLQNIHTKPEANTHNQVPLRTEPKNEILQNEMSILIAEDTKMNMMVITNMLLNIVPQATLFEASNGVEVLEMLTDLVPDMILMDVQMPVMDGLEATRQIRKNTLLLSSKVPIIALTAGVSKDERQNCYAAGMNDFLSKPIDKDLLYQTVLKYLVSPPQIEPILDIAKTTDHSHFDKDKLSQKIGNNVELLKQMTELAIIEYPKYLNAISKAINEIDKPQIKISAHTLKGSAYNMEFIHLGNIAHEIETSIDNMEELHVLLQRMNKEWEVIVKILSE